MRSGSPGQVAPARGRPSSWIRLRNSFDLPPNASSWPSLRTAGKTRPCGPGWRSGGSAVPNYTISRDQRCVPTLHCGDTGYPPTVRPLNPTEPHPHEALVRFQSPWSRRPAFLRVPTPRPTWRDEFPPVQNDRYCNAMCAPHKKTLTLAQMTPKIDKSAFGWRTLDATATGCIFSVAVLDHALPGLHWAAGVSHHHADQAAFRSGGFHLRLRAVRHPGHPHDISQSNKDRSGVRAAGGAMRTGSPG
jgi:hypothetical protein